MNSPEVDEILAVYRRREEDEHDRYSLLEGTNLRRVHERELALIEGLRHRGIRDLGGLKVLDVGCGSGGELERLISLGADPRALHGIDLRPDAVDRAHARSLSGVRVGDARSLPFPDADFDVVMQFTALSSMRSAEMRADVAREMVRVTKPGGVIVSYDFVWNPTNRDTVGVPKSELIRLFGPLPVNVRRVTLAPPIERRSERIAALNALLRRIPLLRSHLLAFVDVPGRSP